ncbi:hypothetical protein SS1G_12936 [Paecilomyces variotii No. 5]|uniref:BZIP domain-containing protein n=1 Tax=Byssochlamys spectabilis (strain No. 5 / NBRC 109023) TaxID=1356009 RepID=V5GCY6_BYSSN|nr:hypothetical protein SS1G_12936 [Paecilomyces variotii No. 5]
MSELPIRPLASVAHIRQPEEDWTGRSSAAQRRKLQNRLNQRARRERKVIEDLQKGIVRRPRGRPKKGGSVAGSTPLSSKDSNENVSHSDSSNGASPDAGIVEETITSSAAAAISRQGNQPEQRARLQPAMTYICQLDAPSVLQLIERLEAKVQTYLHNDPSADMLLSLTQYNVFRAILRNMVVLGLDMEDMKDDVTSIFNSANYSDSTLQLPPILLPTVLQRTIPHHPWIDPFPHPSIRDALLIADGTYDDVELCNDLIGQCGDGGTGQVGIIIWGDPWDAYAWEMTEEFARKWFWIFSGCRELLVATNYWRAQRGERKLFNV